MRPLLECGLLDRVIMTTFKSDGSVLDQLVLRCTQVGTPVNERNEMVPLTQQMIVALEDQARSAILKLSMLDESHLSQLPDGCTWQLMVATKADIDAAQSDVLTATLTDQNWIIENSFLPEVLGASADGMRRQQPQQQEVQAQLQTGGSRKRGLSSASMVPIKSIITDALKVEIEMNLR